jgi:hypothetical protein
MKQLNLQSQNLTIHYFSFNIDGSLQLAYLRKIAAYRFEYFGFTATFRREQLDQRETFFSSDKNSYQVVFRHYDYNPKAKCFWKSTKVDFTGENGKHFYNQIKKNQLDWKIFDLTILTLARIDVNYFRQPKIIDKNQFIEDLMELSRRRIVTKDKRRKARWEYEEKGLVLRVGKGGSSKYYWVYETNRGLKFEFEFKPSESFKKLLIVYNSLNIS